MNTNNAANLIESYMHREVDIDTLDGPYIAKGIHLDGHDATEKLGVGRDFIPFKQIRLGSEPSYENHGKSYLNMDDFSGSAYKLSESDHSKITAALS